jgi:hypothetical protein
MCPGRVSSARREVWTISRSRRPSRMALASVRWHCRGSPATILGADANRARADALAPEPSPYGSLHGRGRKRPKQRIAAGVLGTAVFVAAWIPLTGGHFDRTQAPAARGPTVRTMSDETRPYPSLDQKKRQRRRTDNKTVGALAVAVAIGSIAVAPTLGTLRDRTRQHRPTSRRWPRGPPRSLTLLDLRTGRRTPLGESLVGSSS